MNKLLIAGAVIFALILIVIIGIGCFENNAQIPKEGKVMKDVDGNAYLVKFQGGNVYTLDPLPELNEHKER